MGKSVGGHSSSSPVELVSVSLEAKLDRTPGWDQLPNVTQGCLEVIFARMFIWSTAEHALFTLTPGESEAHGDHREWPSHFKLVNVQKCLRTMVLMHVKDMNILRVLPLRVSLAAVSVPRPTFFTYSLMAAIIPQLSEYMYFLNV